MTMRRFTDPKSILIVDDDPIARQNFIQICEDLNLFKNIIEAADGRVAFQKIINQDFDVILLDLKMPRKSGVDVIRDAVLKNPEIAERIIVISGNVEQETLQILVSKKVTNILVKPFSNEDIENKIKKILARGMKAKAA
jgi:YesN/AraC family two-component response regulator